MGHPCTTSLLIAVHLLATAQHVPSVVLNMPAHCNSSGGAASDIVGSLVSCWRRQVNVATCESRR